MVRKALSLVALTALILPSGLHAAAKGDDAPAIKSKTWFNGKVNWSDVRGRVVLVEKWATY